MRITKTIALTATLAAAGTTSLAGGMGDVVMEAPVAMEEEMAPAGSSLSPTLIVVGILAALLLAASSSDDDSSDG